MSERQHQTGPGSERDADARIAQACLLLEDVVGAYDLPSEAVMNLFDVWLVLQGNQILNEDVLPNGRREC